MKPKIFVLFWGLFFVPALFPSIPAFSQDTPPTPGAFAQTAAPQERQEFAAEFFQFTNISVACPAAAPPYYFVDEDGEAQGLIIDIWRSWSEKTGISITFVPVEWVEALTLVGDGHIDVHPGLFPSPEREALLDFVTPVHHFDHYVFYHQSISGLHTLQDLAAFKIGVSQGTYTEEFLRQHAPETPLALYSGYTDMLDAAERGEIRVFVNEVVMMLQALKERGLMDKYRFHPEQPLFSRPSWAAVQKGNTALAATIVRGMERVTPEERAAIERKWLGTSIVKTKDTLVIAMSQTFRPFTFLNAEAQPAGLFVDMWKLWAERSGQNIEFRPSGWQETLNNLKDGDADIHAGLFYSDSRAQWMDFSQPFYGLNIEVFFPVKQGKISSLNELNGQKVGVAGGTHMEEYLRQHYPEIEVVTFRSNEAVLRAARDGQIRAFLAGYPETAAILDHLGWSGEFDSFAEAVYTRKFHAGILKDNWKLLNLIDQGLNAISNQELADIERRWMPDPDHRYYRLHHHELRFTAAEEAWLREHRGVRVGMYPIAPPLAFSDEDDGLQGLLIDYSLLLGTRTGLRFEFVPAAPLELPALLTDRKIDVYHGTGELDSSQERNYSQSFLSMTWGIINRVNSPLVTGIRDLRDQTVTLTRATLPLQQHLAEQYPDITIQFTDTLEQALQEVAANRADACISALIPASYLIRQHKFTSLKIAAPADFPNINFKFVMRPDSPELQSILDKGIALIAPEEHDKMYERWLPVQYEHTVNWTRVWEWIAAIVAVSGILLGATLFWNRRLSREVRERKRAEQALADARDELEFRVEERTVELAHVNKSLREKEERLRVLFNSARDNILAHPIDDNGLPGRYIEVNESTCETLGYSREELLRMGPQDITVVDDPVMIAEISQQIMQNGHALFEATGMTKDGRKIPFEISAHLIEIGDERLIMAVSRNIAERKQAEEALRKSENRLRNLFETMTEGIILIEPDGRIVQANPAAEAILGLKRSEIEERNYVSPDWKILRPDGTPMPPEEMAGPQAMHEKRPVKNVLMGVQHSDGTISWLNVNATPIMNETGELEGVVGTFADVTDRKHAEDALRISQEKYQAIYENAQAGLARTSIQDGTFLECNPVMAQMLGYDSPAECIADYVTSEHYVDPHARQALLVELERIGQVNDFEAELTRRDGQSIWLRFTGSIDKKRGYIESVVIDITKRKHAEIELEHYRHHLEDLVNERTCELEDRTKELEAFNKTMIDREMRIIEMKEEVNRLCAELGREPEYPPVWK